MLAKPWCVLFTPVCLFVCSLGPACFGLKTWLFQMSMSSCTTDWLLRPSSGCLQFGKNLWHLQTSGNVCLSGFSLFGNFHHGHCYTFFFFFFLWDSLFGNFYHWHFNIFWFFRFFETDSEQVRTACLPSLIGHGHATVLKNIFSFFLLFFSPFIFFVCCCPKIICFLPASLSRIFSLMCLTLINMSYCGHWR